MIDILHKIEVLEEANAILRQNRERAHARIAELEADLRNAHFGVQVQVKRAEEAEGQFLALHRAVNAYRAGVMALNPALSEALVAHLPSPQGGDSEF